MGNEPFYKEIKRIDVKKIPEASPRVEALSEHRNAHNEYAYDRDLPTVASKKVGDATLRVEELAR